MAVLTSTKWAVDNNHSVAQFKVRHLGVANITGSFKVFNGELILEDEVLPGDELIVEDGPGIAGTLESSNFDGAKVHFVVDTNSLDTNQAQRDGHLKGPDFLHAEQFPTMIFDGVLRKARGQGSHERGIDGREGDGRYTVGGELTIRDVTNAVTFGAEFTGMGKGRMGDNRVGFEVDGKINRKDFGLVWSMLTESGGLVVGEEVKMHFDVELIREG
jgi:polyisoprenoid-binding protein YceI